MTLVLAIDWSADSTAVTIIDIAGRSIVAEGRSLHVPGTTAKETTPNWWKSLVSATHTAPLGRRRRVAHRTIRTRCR
ncbi:MAG: hypothetical protein JHC63_03750 [Acidimicrobiia bacterium]|nr:hypothetical protein [Acidimicrobiia bacterium]